MVFAAIIPHLGKLSFVASMFAYPMITQQLSSASQDSYGKTTDPSKANQYDFGSTYDSFHNYNQPEADQHNVEPDYQRRTLAAQTALNKARNYSMALNTNAPLEFQNTLDTQVEIARSAYKQDTRSKIQGLMNQRIVTDKISKIAMS